ncbi:MAG TPA: hypothetical protein VGR45_15110 [Stellaceae bacterium]|nr:hypothetical protein [Stellaceae bacterium]
MQEYVRYPLVMKHPSHRPAVIRHTVAATNLSPEAAQQFQNRVGAEQPQQGAGSAELYPDVIVKSEDDEAYYVSRGYVPAGGADPAGARTIQAAPLPANYRPHQWPRAVGDQVVGDPNAPTGDPNEYPKYIAALDAIALNACHEATLRAAAAEAEVDAEIERVRDEDKETREWERVVDPKAARSLALRSVERKPRKVAATNPERTELLRMARDLGLKPFNGWSIEKLRAMVEAATAPKAEDAA